MAATPAMIRPRSDRPIEAYEAPSRALLEEHTRVAMDVSSGIPVPTSAETITVDLGVLSSSHQGLVFRELIKIIMTIRQTHISITTLCMQQTSIDALFTSWADLAYQEFKLLTSITNATVAPHPDNLFVLLSMFKPLTDLFSLAKEKFLPVMKVLSLEDHAHSLATGFDSALLALGSTVRSTIEMVKAWISGYANTAIPDGGGVHEITRYVMMYIKLLSEHRVLLNIILFNVTLGTGDDASTTETPERIMADLMFRLESTLVKLSAGYHVAATRWLFLVNNMHFIQQQQTILDVFEDDSSVRRDNTDFYIYMYLDVSWAPVLSCLRNRVKMIPACFKPPSTRRFNTMFEKTYQAQRSWKVEDPLLRKHVRQAVTEKVIPAYRSFLEKQERKHAKLIEHTPEELEEMLSELFEG
ncbi:unnamed protein product [Urochloa decumbens]|uniref:Exocyst subunit Exo70 family protein n=1 Tax=Urochloa decumbens TaxID=240449 RepID=A0ABC9CM25_9POAL